MSICQVQMQAGLSLHKFTELYGTEQKCTDALISAKWPDGFQCSSCNGNQVTICYRGEKTYWRCHNCDHQTSLTAGTMMQSTRLPLIKWFLALYWMTQYKNNIAALSLRRLLDISWKTAWLLKHKIMEAMYQEEATLPLSGNVVIDDAYLGGELCGGSRGRGSENKVPFIAAIEDIDGRPGRVRFDIVSGFSSVAIDKWAKIALGIVSYVVSDGLMGFRALRANFSHEAILCPKGKEGTEVKPFKWLNTVLGNLKTSFAGTHHAFGFKKYGFRYLASYQYRFNRRFDLVSIFCAGLETLANAIPCPYGRILKIV